MPHNHAADSAGARHYAAALQLLQAVVRMAPQAPPAAPSQQPPLSPQPPCQSGVQAEAEAEEAEAVSAR